uniref:Annexin n=3 Tax=Onchocerca TaxID=6281 RepID=A0A158N8S5_ONCVO
MLKMSYQFYGTIKPKVDFNAEVAADTLYDAMKGSGCDKYRVIQVIAHCNNAQRQMIRTPYKIKYGKDLIDELKKELSGDFEDVIIGLMETPTKYDAMQLQKAMKGLGTTELTLIDILCSRNDDELEAIKNEYKEEYGRTLESDIVGDTSGDFKELLLALLNNRRDQSYNVNYLKAREVAKRMFGNKEKKEKPDKEAYKMVLSQENFRQIQKLFSEYQSMTGEPLTTAVERVFSGDAKVAYLALIDSIQNKPRFFAKQLYDAMKGLGTDDQHLIRIIVSRSEIDLALIREEFERMYKKPLIDWIKSECSGPYRDALIVIVKGN